MLHFITSNKKKLEEIRSILGDIEALDIDLPEVQEIDAHVIIKEKLKEAQKGNRGKFIVEDTSLYLEVLNGLPGPLVKWFMKTIGIDGLYDITDKLGNNNAEAKTIIGYADDDGNIDFFEGAVKGKIVKPRGPKDFGWDPIFKPEGYDKTFAEMDSDEKNKISMRRIALNKLNNYLKS